MVCTGVEHVELKLFMVCKSNYFTTRITVLYELPPVAVLLSKMQYSVLYDKICSVIFATYSTTFMPEIILYECRKVRKNIVK